MLWPHQRPAEVNGCPSDLFGLAHPGLGVVFYFAVLQSTKICPATGCCAVKKAKGDRFWFKIALAVVPRVARAYFTLVDLTSRKIFLNKEYEDECGKRGSFAVAGFHGSALFSAYYFGRYRTLIMVSRSFDGELVDRVVKAWGNITCRGSSSRGGREALAEMIDQVKKFNCCTGLAVDAPRGPAGKVKMGVVILARDTGQPVLPAATWTTRHIQFNSWDKMILPLPFSTIVIAFGKPLEVPKGLERDDYERIRQEIEENLANAQNEAKAKVRQLKASQSQRPLAPISKETPSLPVGNNPGSI